MKVAVLGIDFPLGKVPFLDLRLEKLRNLLHSIEVVHIQVEFQDQNHLKTADAVLCAEEEKIDLVLEDLEIIETKLNSSPHQPLFLRCKEALEKEIILNEVPLTDEEKKLLSGLNLVTLKPIISVKKDNLPAVPELVQKILSDCGMISFFTANERQLRAWLIKKGTSVYAAAGNIHSDIQKGFIKAEVIAYEDLIKSGGLNQARGRGLVRLEDKDYTVKDGDLIQIRFNV
ncbi:MAG: DUF933 domain-containing protein [Candidatus Omnitrophica bacterium]|nr:DUF933 domain-containing protein [Candidatus Omnitrophota bacterium]